MVFYVDDFIVHFVQKKICLFVFALILKVANVIYIKFGMQSLTASSASKASSGHFQRICLTNKEFWIFV